MKLQKKDKIWFCCESGAYFWSRVKSNLVCLKFEPESDSNLLKNYCLKLSLPGRRKHVTTEDVSKLAESQMWSGL